MSAVLKDEDLPARDVALEWLTSHGRPDCVTESISRPRVDRADVCYRRTRHGWTLIGYSNGVAVVVVPTGEIVQGMLEMEFAGNGWRVARSLTVIPHSLIGGHVSELAYSETSGVRTWERLSLKIWPFPPERAKLISILPEEQPATA